MKQKQKENNLDEEPETERKEVLESQLDLSNVSLDSDFSANNNLINFYINEEPRDFEQIHRFEMSSCPSRGDVAVPPNEKNSIMVCSSEFNSSIYHFILPLRAQYLQKIQPISEFVRLLSGKFSKPENRYGIDI